MKILCEPLRLCGLKTSKTDPPDKPEDDERLSVAF